VPPQLRLQVSLRWFREGGQLYRFLKQLRRIQWVQTVREQTGCAQVFLLIEARLVIGTSTNQLRGDDCPSFCTRENNALECVSHRIGAEGVAAIAASQRRAKPSRCLIGPL
jgi:hypothetical protein